MTEYNPADKSNCWYLQICDKSKCNEFCVRHYKMSSLVDMALLEGKQRYSIPLTPDKCDYEAYVRLREIKNNMKSFVDDGKNLLIYSKNTGNGKTEYSKKLLLSYLDSVWSTTDFVPRALFISMPKFIIAMKENISKPNEYFQYINENIYKVDLVVWDEINYKEWSQFEQDYMLNVISDRIAVGKSNIYTTNYVLSDIEKRLGSRLASRIIGCSELVEFKGTDKRSLSTNGGVNR